MNLNQVTAACPACSALILPVCKSEADIDPAVQQNKPSPAHFMHFHKWKLSFIFKELKTNKTNVFKWNIVSTKADNRPKHCALQLQPKALFSFLLAGLQDPATRTVARIGFGKGPESMHWITQINHTNAKSAPWQLLHVTLFVEKQQWTIACKRPQFLGSLRIHLPKEIQGLSQSCQ